MSSSDQQSKFDAVRKCLRRDWRNDNAILLQYFTACSENWKIYKGDRTTKQVNRLNAIYRQATIGDSSWVQTETCSKKEIEREIEWYRLKGMPQDMAKRRYITYLAEINPLLIDVMPSERPPAGFPTDRKGRIICAKCNTAVGCQRPVLDMHKGQLRMQLLENEKLHESDKVREFIAEAMKAHQCMWGIHTFIHRADAKPFMEWFELPENQGFQPYDFSPLFSIVKDLVIYHYELAWDMQQHKAEYSVDDMNAQLIRTKDLKKYYEELSGSEFFFHIPCNRDNDICNDRRQGDKGINHTHPVELDEPTFRKPTFEDLMQLRQQCVELGIKPQIGIETDIGKRCKIYQERILEHFERLKKSAEAKHKNDARLEVHKKEKADILRTSTQMSQHQVWEASNALSIASIDNLMKKRCNLNTESSRGQTPLIAMALCGASTDMFLRAIQCGAEAEFCNKFGMTALMVACRRRDAAAMHALLKNGASALTCDPVKKSSALHLCAFYGLETEAQILYDYVKEGAGDSLKVVNFLNAKNKTGDTALIVAARRRNGLMCKFLLGLGADPGARNLQGRTAATAARDSGWVELAEWLGTKVGGGIKKVETVSDQSMERRMRFGMMTVRDKIRDFVQKYITLLYGSNFANHVNTCPLGTPAWVDELKQEKISLQSDFQKLVEAQYRYIYAPVADHRYDIIKAEKAAIDRESGALSPAKPPSGLSRSVTSLNKIHWAPEVAELRLLCREILAVIQKGDAAPDTEGTKPRPWTPMMCAAAINDTDTMKRLLREGSDINCGNKSGTTPLMLTSQLNVVDSVAFLLQNGADLNQVDMHGYAAIAYATSLPLPVELTESLASYMSDGDTSFERRLNAEKLIKLAARYGNQGLNSVLDFNALETGPAEKAEWVRYHSLLESHGLSRIETNWQLHNSIKNAGNRLNCDVDEKFHSTTPYNEDSETESEIAEKEAYMAMLETKRLERERKAELDSLRCPICTLQTPCPHFLNPKTLKKLIDGGYKPPPKVSIIRDGSILSKKQIEFLTQRVLTETGLGDRHTDRTLDALREYQKRIKELDKAKTALLLEATENAESEENEAETAEFINQSHRLERRGAMTTLAIAQNLVVQDWRQEIDEYGRITFKNNFTEEAWSMHITIERGEAKAYYYNAATDCTQWEPPGSLAGLSLEVLSKAFETATERKILSIEPAPNAVTESQISETNEAGVSYTNEPVLNISEKKKKKKKKGGVKFMMEDNISTFEGDAPSTEINFLSSCTISDKTSDDDVQASDHKNAATESGTVNTISIESISTDVKVDSTGELVSALKSVTGEDKKKKKRVGGIRFTDDSNSDTVVEEVRFIEAIAYDDNDSKNSYELYSNEQTDPKEGINAESKSPESFGGDTKDVFGAKLQVKGSDNELVQLNDVKSNEMVFPEETTETMIAEINEMVKIPVQPLPPNERKVFSFTKNTTLGARVVDGVIPSEHTSDFNSFPAKFTSSMALAIRTSTNEAPSAQKLRGDYPVLVSGWIFSGIAVPLSHPSVTLPNIDMNGSQSELGSFSATSFHNERKKIAADMQVSPIEEVNVSLESWGITLEFVRLTAINEFLPLMEFKSTVNPKNWKIGNERCPLCRLGVVRYKIDPSDSEESKAVSTLLTNYCMTCALRCVLYNKIRKCTPRAQKAKLVKDWPVYLPPEYYPLQRGQRSPIHHSLSASNLNLLGVAIDAAALKADKVNKYDMPNVLSPKKGNGSPPRSPTGRTGSPSKNKTQLNSSDRAMSPAHAVVKRMLSMHDPDSDDEKDNVVVRQLSPKGKSKFLNKTLKNSPPKSNSKKSDNMPTFMKKFSASNLIQDNYYDIPIPEPEPLPDMNLETRYGPQELALVPFLIAKGQYDEVERLLRVAMCLEDVLGEGGVVYTVHILLLQADMYMLLDLVPLALGLYLDSVDILGASLGLEDIRFVEAVYMLISCARKMGLSEAVINSYTMSLCKSLESSMVSSKQAMVDMIDKMDIRSQKNQYIADEIFVQLREHDSFLHSNSAHQQMLSSLRGLLSFVNVLESPNGLASVARVMFAQYCFETPLSAFDSKNSSVNTVKTYGPVAQFVVMCCRIRQCQDSEVYRFLIQNLVQKYLSKHENVIGNLVRDSGCIIEDIRLRITEKLEKKGRAISIDAFDVLLKKCILFLLPLYPHFIRTFPEAKRIIIFEFLDSEAEFVHVSAVIIQSFWRQKYMKWQVNRRRANRNILKQLHASGNGVFERDK